MILGALLSLVSGSLLENLTGNQRCAYCADEGWVVVDSGDPLDEAWAERVRGMPLADRRKRGLARVVYGEALAPCPYCEQGKVNENPPKDAAKREMQTPWGREGYWRGRSTAELRPVDTGSKPLPREEAKRKAAELAGRYGSTLKLVDEEIAPRLGFDVEIAEGAKESEA